MKREPRWKTRTLDELLAAEPRIRTGTNENVVMVNTEEGRLLNAACARVISGNENMITNTQYYEIGDKKFMWLAGYADGNFDDTWPVDRVDPRLRAAAEGRYIDWS